MQRSGALSDARIRQNCPEFQPLSLQTHQIMNPVSVHRHAMHGVRLPKEFKSSREISRYPSNDLFNYAQITNPGNHIQTYTRNVARYASHIHAVHTDNADEFADNAANLESLEAFKGPTLHLGSLPRHTAWKKFNAIPTGINKNLLPVQSRALIANLIHEDGMHRIADILYPDQSTYTSLSHGEVLSKLNHHFRENEADLNVIQAANIAMSHHGVVPTLDE